MSFTRTVPAAVPSDLHSSRPLPPMIPANSTRPPATAISPTAGPGARTWTVPALVPSLFHRVPFSTSGEVRKNRVPFRLTKPAGTLESSPGTRSLKRTVPAFVPSLLHSSSPWRPSTPPKYSVDPRPKNGPMWLSSPEMKVRSMIVPASVPSLVHRRSIPTLSVTKNRRPPTLVNSWGRDESTPGIRSLTSEVPSGVPSLRHSSTPCTPSSAPKYRNGTGPGAAGTGPHIGEHGRAVRRAVAAPQFSAVDPVVAGEPQRPGESDGGVGPAGAGHGLRVDVLHQMRGRGGRGRRPRGDEERGGDGDEDDERGAT